MFILHIALQGCLKPEPVDYGLTADTGGHIRYLLELADASARDPRIDRIQVVTRGFEDDDLGHRYSTECEDIGPKQRLCRLFTTNYSYLAKEELAGEHDELLAALLAHIDRLDRSPDLVHAHYADAGRLAADLKALRGIPYVFTGHSLGAVKRNITGNDGPGIRERISIEERAIAHADLVVASSRDEAEFQYPNYEGYDPGRIRVVAPGSDLKAFAEAVPTIAIDEMMGRFLRAPERPAIFAIARPVSKKNLAALVHAYGQSETLRHCTNLVLVAGTRSDAGEMGGECGDNLREILHLIDRYDLYGQVAYPKHHNSIDVPSIYAWVRETGGVFVNPALNEPFGLTLLEAAAAGLPVVATDSGGPNDIIEACQNGKLVSPTDTDAIAEACEILITDRALWQACATRGRDAVRRFDWNAHVRIYHRLAAELADPPARRSIGRDLMLASDIDNTLTGCPKGLASLMNWRRTSPSVLFGIATGRSFASAMSILDQSDVASPQFVISSVGSDIYHQRADAPTYERDLAWAEHIDFGWDRAATEAALHGMDELRPQAPLEQREHKLSYFSSGDNTLVERIRHRLRGEGIAATVIRSHERYLDILPQRASKGAAVEHVRKHYGIAKHAVIAAGDSGNDVEMLRSVPNSIIVANYSDGLAERQDLAHAYVARARHAAGVLEGVQHFRRRAA
ncbi:MAG: HAD-IIB family hydrolase [Pacificimonas sp.]